MALANSGSMSIGGTVANRSINVELGLAQNANSSLGQTNFRTLAGIASGTISMDDFYGKSASTCTVFDTSTDHSEAVKACGDFNKVTSYHGGSGSLPVSGDAVYSDSSCTTALVDGFYNLRNGTYMYVSNGTVTNIFDCPKAK